MNSVMRSKTLKYFIAIAFLYSPYSFGISVQQCVDDAKGLYQQAGGQISQASQMQAVAAQVLGSSSGQNIHENAGNDQNFANAASNLSRQTAANIRTIGQECAKKCDPSQAEGSTTQEKQINAQNIQKMKSVCENSIEDLAQRADGAAAQTDIAGKQAGDTKNASGGMSPMMAGLLGAALGGAAGYMMGKKQGEKDKDKDKDKKDEDVVADDGTVDCTKSGAEAYSDCNGYFESKCATDSSAEGCSNFTARYCSMGTSETDTSTDTSDDSAAVASASDKDISGEGMGTQFCFTAQATTFCQTSGRETCPSCLQLEANKAEACQSNPTLCLMQNSQAEIEAAKNTCPSDPLFSNPDYVAGGGATVENPESLDDPILPGQYSSSSTSDMVGGTAANDDSSNGSSSSSSQPDDVADGSGSSSGSGGSGSGVIGSSPSDVGSGGVSDPVLPTGGLQFASATGDRTAASVGEAMGPSLFSMSSAMIESRCKSAQLAHCSR